MGDKGGLLSGNVADEPSPLAEMNLAERVAADYHGASLSVGPTRWRCCAIGCGSRASSRRSRPGGPPWSALAYGRPVHRQAASSDGQGFCFLTLEDESGLINIILPPAVYEAHAAILRSSSMLLVEGLLQRQDGAISLKADSVAGV